jgi:YegS/Rv2252/BmrU family lipid kinase
MTQSTNEDSICIILNPHADKGRALKKRAHIESLCDKYHLTYEIRLTTGPLDAIDIAKEAVLSGFNTIISAGGDGTANEVLDGMVRGIREKGLSFATSPVFGIIPIGRGNDFSFSAGIPRNIEDAIELISREEWSSTDYGELFGGRFEEGRCFLNGVGIGFEPLVNFVASDFKRIHGMASYFLGVVQVMLHYPKATKIFVTVDDEEFTVETQQLSVCNGRRMGSMFIMGPVASVDDGVFDMVYANKPLTGMQILLLALRFFKGTQLKTPHFSLLRGKKVTLRAKEATLVCHTDGEEVSRGCESIVIQLFPGELKCLRNA